MARLARVVVPNCPHHPPSPVGFAELVTGQDRKPLAMNQPFATAGEPQEILLGGMHRVVMNRHTKATFSASAAGGDGGAAGGNGAPTTPQRRQNGRDAHAGKVPYEIQLAQGELYVEVVPVLGNGVRNRFLAATWFRAVSQACFSCASGRGMVAAGGVGGEFIESARRGRSLWSAASDPRKSGRRRRFCLPGGWVFNPGRSWLGRRVARFFCFFASRIVGHLVHDPKRRGRPCGADAALQGLPRFSGLLPVCSSLQPGRTLPGINGVRNRFFEFRLLFAVPAAGYGHA